MREVLRLAHAAQVARQPETAEIPHGVAYQTDQEGAPQRARTEKPAQREGLLLLAGGGHPVYVDRTVENLLRRRAVDDHPQPRDDETRHTGHEEHLLPVRKPAHEPCDHQRCDHRAQRSADRTKAVGRRTLPLLEPERHGHQLSGEDRRLGQSQDATAHGKLPDRLRQAAADAGQRPDGDACEHHPLGAEPVDQNPRYGVHQRVTDQEDVDDPCVLHVADAEMFQNFGFEDREQLPVEVVADDGDEHGRHDHPFAFVRVFE